MPDCRQAAREPPSARDQREAERDARHERRKLATLAPRMYRAIAARREIPGCD